MDGWCENEINGRTMHGRTLQKSSIESCRHCSACGCPVPVTVAQKQAAEWYCDRCGGDKSSEQGKPCHECGRCCVQSEV